ncbi:glycosyltransferase [Svornostia abyssi]|uniref:Glycosyltransferase n=1 Tax=Svornostia abyssi TaxID=2898438 RepID=A0ABY5PN78_9ACTN|nr:glycosyltransferase [Parviterribacteraceae bacterium J379]
MRILLVSQMYPSATDPDLGAFVALVERELAAQGHELRHAVIDHRGGSPMKHARLLRRAVMTARRFGPDVVYAHFLVPAGTAAAIAAAAGGAPLVLTAHGTDVANAERHAALRAATRATVSRASAVIAVSDHLAARLAAAVPQAREKTTVIDCGVDLAVFAPRDAQDARASVGWTGEGPFVVCAGTLAERKNVLRLADAFGRLGRGQLAFVGDGPLRDVVATRPGVRVTGRVAHDEVPAWLAAADVVAQPSVLEPFGQVTLEGMAMARPVLATRIGGPPEFVPAGAGVLVDPESTDDIERGLHAALALPCPNPAARAAALEHGSERQAARIAAVLTRATTRRAA